MKRITARGELAADLVYEGLTALLLAAAFWLTLVLAWPGT